MTSTTSLSYAGFRFPPAIISHAVWLYFRFPLSLRMLEEMLAARGIVASHETVRQWGRKFGQALANQIRRQLPRPADKRHFDEAAITIAGRKHWLWRAVDQHGQVVDNLIQSRRNSAAAKRLMRKLLKWQGWAPRVMVTDKQDNPLCPSAMSRTIGAVRRAHHRLFQRRQDGSQRHQWRGRLRTPGLAPFAKVKRGSGQLKHRGCYGSPRVHAALRAEGFCAGRGRVARLMRRHGLRGAAARRLMPTTTDSRHGLPVAPDLLGQAFQVAEPNRVWLADITCVPTGEGWLYLAAMLDLGTRKVVG